MLEEIYVLYYMNQPILYGKRKKIYSSKEALENAISHLSKRNVRKRITSWKDYSEDEKLKMIQKEKAKFTFGKYKLEIN